jgi:hypothetical protein
VPSPFTLLLIVKLLRQSVILQELFGFDTNPAAYFAEVLMVPPTVQPEMLSIPLCLPTYPAEYSLPVTMSTFIVQFSTFTLPQH